MEAHFLDLRCIFHAAHHSPWYSVICDADHARDFPYACTCSWVWFAVASSFPHIVYVSLSHEMHAHTCMHTCTLKLGCVFHASRLCVCHKGICAVCTYMHTYVLKPGALFIQHTVCLEKLTRLCGVPLHTRIHSPGIHTYIRACIHTYIHTCIHTYIHTYAVWFVFSQRQSPS